jgi:large subunit ribosomal protein L9
MLVILRENVENLGRIGDVVKVSDGYARNFLLPRKLVAAADEKNVTALEHQRRTLEKKRQAQKATSLELAQRLADFSCTISRKVGENDKLFGSVSNNDIAEALKKAGFAVDRRSVQLEGALKTLGVHPVTIRLDTDVEATVKVWIVKDNS